MKFLPSILLLLQFGTAVAQLQYDSITTHFVINDLEYLERTGVNVMLAHDFYPESHQGGVGIIQNGVRVATNGDLRLESAPGQWQPVPKVGERLVDRRNQEISVVMSYPDKSKDKIGFNPIDYPDLNFSYTLKIKPAGTSFKIIVDLDKPLPEEWIGRVGLNIELFPGLLFGKSYYMDDSFGIFNRQANGPGKTNKYGIYELEPMATGSRLTIAPENSEQTMTIVNVDGSPLQLLDGRAQHSNGWFIVRSLIPSGATKNAIEWLVEPIAKENFVYDPIVQVSQVGYHPKQNKVAVIETDINDVPRVLSLFRINEQGGKVQISSDIPELWGDFLRYRYYQYDFTQITEPGIYQIQYGNFMTSPFQISESVFTRNVWQPTLEYFLPVQMCHMRVKDRYKIWHGLCHIDDARMAPINMNHFDGYLQGPQTFTAYETGEHVPGLNAGGWHDAGDYDIRIESQSATVHGLSQIYELFKIDYDNTTIDRSAQRVDMLTPDGIPDILQQIEHGVISIVGGYTNMGRFYRGLIVPTLDQYRLLGDPVNHSDGKDYDGRNVSQEFQWGKMGEPDDRWVFTESNPRREISTAAALAAAARVLKIHNPVLSNSCLRIAEDIWSLSKKEDPLLRMGLAVELFQTTSAKKYREYILKNEESIINNIANTGWLVGPILPHLNDVDFNTKIETAIKSYFKKIEELGKRTPYGIPYEPNIWGAGWGIQSFGVKQYFLHTSFPDIFPNTYMFNALNFILGVHPGVNTSSFTSGVGSKSITQAYGVNRGEFSYIPGGIGSGTALIRPDFPELLEWPFLWQQTEYVLGGGTTDYLLLVLGTQKLLTDTIKTTSK